MLLVLRLALLKNRGLKFGSQKLGGPFVRISILF